MITRLGDQLQCAGFALHGSVTPETSRALIRRLIDAMALTEAPGGTCCSYPIDGRGGVGFTIFQPITESFIVIDAWPDLGGGYLMICSCKSVHLAVVIGEIETAGFRIGQHFFRPLALDRPEDPDCRLGRSMSSGTGE